MKHQTLIIAIALTLLTSCAKEGAIGPVGNTGATGATGATGSNASTAYQIKFTVSSSNWGQVGTSGQPGAHVYAALTSPYLRYDSVGLGAIVVYTNYGTGTGLQAWSYTSYSSSGIRYDHQYNWNSGVVNADIFGSDYLFVYPNYTFTIVVIPGIHKRLPDLTDYEAVVNEFHPRTVK